MKRLFIISLLVIASASVFAQARYTLLQEIASYKLAQIDGKKYDVEFGAVYDSLKAYLSVDYALMSVSANGTMKGEAKESVKINRTRNFETKQYIKAEVSGKRPYEVTFTKWKERRSVDVNTKAASEWKTIEQTSQDMDIAFYEKMNGPIKLSGSLKTKIEQFNSRQPDERLMLLEGRDY